MPDNMLFRGEDLEIFNKYRTIINDHCIVCESLDYVKWAMSGTYKAVKCNNCGLIWMYQILNKEGLTKYYSDYIGRRRLNNDIKMKQREEQYKLDVAFIERYINKGKVLDVGCSGGFFLNVLNNDFTKFGVEIDPGAVAFAKEHQKSFGENIQCSDLDGATFNKNIFDLITMRGAIEHVPNPVGSIRKVSQLLKVGGYFYITATPNGSCFLADLYRDKWSLFHPVQHIWHFNPNTLSLICEKFSLKLLATDFPYLGTPYEDVKEDIKLVESSIRQKERRSDAKLPLSPPFFGNMMSLVFVKIS
jgi:2-polyprenyl-3-methyl-5-hydroxy-6-metoxy-1,4-benzoquinol methylase